MNKRKENKKNLCYDKGKFGKKDNKDNLPHF